MISTASWLFDLVLCRLFGGIANLIIATFFAFVYLFRSPEYRRARTAVLQTGSRAAPGQLAEVEIDSRQARIYKLEDLISIDLVETVLGDTRFRDKGRTAPGTMTLTANFRAMEAFSLTFIHPDTAIKLDNLLRKHLQQPCPV